MSITFLHRSVMVWFIGFTQACLCAGALAEAADWQIDSEHFSILFEAEHIGYQQQLGFFLEGSGDFRFDPETEELSDGRVEIVAASLFSNHDARDNHLKGQDFLNVRRYALIVFDVAEYRAAEGILRGDLTLLDETHAVDLEVTVNKQAAYPFGHRKETLGVSARASILRSKWGMDYGVANNMIGDEVKLRFEFEAIRD